MGATGEVFNAPIDDVVQPDLAIVADARQVSKRGIETRRYAELGIQNCWVLDPEAAGLECYRAEAAGYGLVLEARGESRVTHPDWAGLTLDLPALWR